MGLMVERSRAPPRSTTAGCLRRDGQARQAHQPGWGNGLRGYDLGYARQVPRVRKFEWGRPQEHAFAGTHALSLASLSIGSQARGARIASIGSFASSQATSYAETAQRLLEPQGSGYLETRPSHVDIAERDKRVAKQWFSPERVGNLKQRRRKYKTPGSRGAAQSLRVTKRDYDRRVSLEPELDIFRKAEVANSNSSLYGSMRGQRTSQPGTVASSTEAYRAKIHEAHSLDFFLDDAPTQAKLFGTESDTNQYGNPPSRADLSSLARVRSPTEDLALLGAAFLVLVDGAADLRWVAFRARAKQPGSAQAALGVRNVDDARRRALHAFLDGRLAANVAPYTTRQARAVRKLEGWVRGALSKADAQIADRYGPAGTPTRPKTPALDLSAVVA